MIFQFFLWEVVIFFWGVGISGLIHYANPNLFSIWSRCPFEIENISTLFLLIGLLILTLPRTLLLASQLF